MAELKEDENNFTIDKHVSELSKSLYQLQQEHSFCDVLILGEDGDIRVHSVVLSAVSPYLKRWVSTFEEGQNSFLSIYLKGELIQDIQNLVTYMYTGVISLSLSNAPRMIKLLKSLEMDSAIVHLIGDTFSSDKRFIEMCLNVKPEKDMWGLFSENSDTERNMGCENGSANSTISPRSDDKIDYGINESDVSTSLDLSKNNNNVTLEAQDETISNVSSTVYPKPEDKIDYEINESDVSTSLDLSNNNSNVTIEAQDETNDSASIRSASSTFYPNSDDKIDYEINESDVSTSLDLSNNNSKVALEAQAETNGSASIRSASSTFYPRCEDKIDYGINESDISTSLDLSNNNCNVKLEAQDEINSVSIAIKMETEEEGLNSETCEFPNITEISVTVKKEPEVEEVNTDKERTARGNRSKMDFTNDISALEERNHMKHKCSKCGYSTTNKINFAKHLKKHLSTKSKVSRNKAKKAQHKCEQCGNEYNSKFGLGLHKKNKHDQSFRYICDSCGKGFNQRLQFQFHNLQHTEIALETCAYCSKKFKAKGSLTRHLKTCQKNPRHCKEKFVCDVCQVSCTSMRGLKSHIEGMHLPPQYTCKHCNRNFAWRSSLKAHKQVAHTFK